MAVFNLFSQRESAARRAGEPDVFIYDSLPRSLVAQIIHIWRDRVERGTRSASRSTIWGDLESALLREFGYLQWPGLGYSSSAEERVSTYFNGSKVSLEEQLDIIEFIFGFLATRSYEYQRERDRDIEALAELNVRFERAGVGYRFEGTQLIRVDSEFAHAEMIKPTLQLLGTAGYEKADEHFRKAHEKYRDGDYPSTVTEAGKAFEATLKALCSERGWNYPAGATAGNLVTTVVKNGLFPPWLSDGLTAYVAMMKTGLPNVRNEGGAHGAAPDAAPVHRYLASYALHLSASNIIMLMGASEASQA
ncbi:STM4504/CBY_0614 family protein [Reyranella sp.]|jgi:hypothetical protein|uniref:STM4504/CBY_0614 family protein n=1 Tax=Reyranella sp. TaxID=1929291 RepID=UPI000BD19203|nr:HEPN domain-containing protein [Reyranella sp.]OYY46049.1 MAG: hypothetical protein B7Y57_04135 [Rhodospirillales bacterium 35-66-84]OYZ96429.1 MAG: hypothetical protein B7Y08_04495 [Rhodospirillales bacterium 24-66-33]OZB28408.1 MAG: hypothetical protein B7X63_00650 [Rhodospirillales bacterium 39-66-50]HQS14384.1 HEPN domain-containing protein [Reyranella sp.]HQT11380.1 HEPN domain-containing protein [Reyranella sp.]